MSTVKLLRTFTQTTGDEIEHIVPEGTFGEIVYEHEGSEDVVVDFLLGEDEWREVWNVPMSILKVIDKECPDCDGDCYVWSYLHDEEIMCEKCNGWGVVE